MKTRLPILLVLAVAAVSLGACASVDFPDQLPAGAPAASAQADNDTAASRADAEKRQRRLARKRDKACEKHPENC